MRHATTKTAFVSWIPDEVCIVFFVIYVVSIRNEIAKMTSMFVAVAFLVMFGVFLAHNFIPLFRPVGRDHHSSMLPAVKIPVKQKRTDVFCLQPVKPVGYC